MRDDDPELFACVRSFIVWHLRHNPNAGDTAEGIARSWFLSEQERLPTVQRVLESLRAQGIVRCAKLPDGKLHFTLRRAPGVRRRGGNGTSG